MLPEELNVCKKIILMSVKDTAVVLDTVYKNAP